ncbi:unnamed protein product [Bubo scandiacus]
MGAPQSTLGAPQSTPGLGGGSRPPWRTMFPSVFVLNPTVMLGHLWVPHSDTQHPWVPHSQPWVPHRQPRVLEVGQGHLGGPQLASCLRQLSPVVTLWRVLLPQGYPESVSPDYLQYQCWDALQALCSTLTGALATRAVLQAVGVGDGAATVTGATLTWVLRDGVGMVTRIAFAWLQGSRLDCEAKQWRLAADLLNDAALALELLAPAWPRAGPALLTMAAVAKCIVGVAGGATRAALAVHQARRDNMADVAAKDSSQETLVNGVGLLLALALLPLLDGRPWLTLGVVTLLVGTHLGANVGAVGALRLLTLNRPRLRLALGGALRGGATARGGAARPQPANEGAEELSVPGPEEVNPREPLLPGFSTPPQPPPGGPPAPAGQ